MAVYFQAISTLSLAYLCTLVGIFNGWPSSTELLFKSTNTTLNRPMGVTEISLLGSLPAIGCLIAMPIAGFMLDVLGRKTSCILTSSILVLAWSIIAVTNQVEIILLAMFISGLGGAVYLVVNVYVSEICQDSIRGAMTSIPIQFYCLGFLISYLLGGYLEYNMMVYTCLFMSVVGVVIVAMMKESPIFLMMKGQEADAAKSIAFYRRQKNTSQEVLQELNKMRRILNSDVKDTQSLTTLNGQVELELVTVGNMSRWQYFKNSSSTRRELFVVLILNFAFIYQGQPIVQVYAEPLFATIVPSDVMSANACSILTGVVAFVAGIISASISDIVGRRPLMCYLPIVSGVCCIVLGAQLLMELGPSWIVPVFINIYTVSYILGTGTVTLVVVTEVFVPKVKSVMLMLVTEWNWICNFTLLFGFHPLVATMGLPLVFFFFAVVCFGTAVFCYYCLPETKGLPLDAIQELFKKQ